MAGDDDCNRIPSYCSSDRLGRHLFDTSNGGYLLSNGSVAGSFAVRNGFEQVSDGLAEFVANRVQRKLVYRGVISCKVAI